LFRGMTIGDICAAACWGSPNTLYLLLVWLIVFLWLGPEVGVRHRAGCAFVRVTTVPCMFEPWAAAVCKVYIIRVTTVSCRFEPRVAVTARKYTVSMLLQVSSYREQ
jgi:hypothetical protein